LGEVDILVPEKYLTEAKKVIDDMNKGLLELPDDKEQGSNTADPDEN
jgi:hypothetical protein